MKLSVLILAVLIMFACSVLSPASCENAPYDYDGINAQVDQYFKSGKTVGGSLVIARDGEIVYTRNYGYSNLKLQKPVNDSTYFKIQSVTKMVSAVGVMRLTEMGLLDLDEDISVYAKYKIVNPYYPAVPITLRQCMSHTSSISENGGYSNTSKENKVYNMLSKEANKRANFEKAEPGTEYRYSNFAGGLMGFAIEAVSGLSVDRFMKDQIFAPMNIDASYYAGYLSRPDEIAGLYSDGKLSRSAAKYINEGYEDFADPESHYRVTVGGLWMRSQDLAKIAAALCGDGSFGDYQLLAKENALQMRTEQRELGTSVKTDSPYGLCINRVDTLIDNKIIFGHQGMSNGSICNVYFDPDTQFVFVLLTNGCSQARDHYISVLAKRMFTYTYSIFTAE